MCRQTLTHLISIPDCISVTALQFVIASNMVEEQTKVYFIKRRGKKITAMEGAAQSFLLELFAGLAGNGGEEGAPSALPPRMDTVIFLLTRP